MKSLLQVLLFDLKKDCGTTDLFVELARQGANRGIQVDFVFTGISHLELANQLEALGSRLYVLEKPWSTRAFAKRLVQLVEKLQPDTADFHFCTFLVFWSIFRKLRAQGIKVVFHYHGEIRPVEELRLHHRHLSRLRFLTSAVDRIICVSHANRRFLEHHRITTPIDVIYNGIDTSKYSLEEVDGDLRTELEIPSDRFLLFFMGSIIHRKGIDILIQGFARALKEEPRLELILVGGGDPQPYQELASELAVTERIHFLGFLADYPFNAFDAADLYVSASRAESFGLSIAEAQLLGLPVVSTAVGGVPEVIDHEATGLLIPTEDPEALAEAILRVAQNSELRTQMSANGPDWIIRKFEIRDRVVELFDLLEKEGPCSESPNPVAERSIRL